MEKEIKRNRTQGASREALQGRKRCSPCSTPGGLGAARGVMVSLKLSHCLVPTATLLSPLLGGAGEGCGPRGVPVGTVTCAFGQNPLSKGAGSKRMGSREMLSYRLGKQGYGIT